ncbi:transcription factor E2F3 isoform X1 [Syngnathus typhle]|uniref:transcription factor E2F3 isoform X1 n=2 Tax=Syngnathus typhle TaxID=161592 RepID=UPI002A6A92D0|nr:transcription factor E2F3 isoform X1 [Syngnathus typhle]
MLGDAMITSGTSEVSCSNKQESPKSLDETQRAPPQQTPTKLVLIWPNPSSDQPAKQKEEELEDDDDPSQDDGIVLSVSDHSALNLSTGEETALYFNPDYNRKSRNDTSLVFLTRKFLDLLQSSKDGILDLNLVSQEINFSKRRIYDVTNVLEGINLIKKIYKNHIQWLGGSPSKDTIQIMNDLAEEEKKLDELIESCTGDLHAMCVDEENSKFAYVTYEDIQTIPTLSDQTLLVIKGPEDTILNVTHPKESFQVHMKSTRGPIDVLICSDEPLPMEVTGGQVDGDANSDHNSANDSYTSFVQMPLKSEPCY